jgi:hypothetical protein
MEFSFVVLAAMALLAVAQLAFEHAHRKLRSDHDRLARVAVFALRDLEWDGIRETETSITADAEHKNVVPFRKPD